MRLPADPSSPPSAPNRVLVTGGCGFIGSSFVRHLLQAYPQAQVLNLDLLTTAGLEANVAGLPPRHQLCVGDINDAPLLRQLFEDFAPDRVIHFAAESHVDRSIHDPGVFVRSNVLGTSTLLEAARRAWAGRADVCFHHISTDEVYGARSPGDPPSPEGAPFAPSSPYAASKAASDHLVAAWAHTFQLPTTITRSCNIYGPRQHPEKLIPLMLLNAALGQELPLYGDGQQQREWLHVDDLCEALLLTLERARPGAVYNISSQRAETNLSVVQALCALLDQRRPEGAPHARLIRYVADRPGHDRRYATDASTIRAELGWSPRLDLARGLAQTVDWYLDNADWVKAARGQAFTEWQRRNYEGRGL